MPQSHDSQDPRPELTPETDGRLTPELEAAAGAPPTSEPTELAVSEPQPPATPPPPAKPSEPEPDEDEDDDGMLRMSFLEHLEELRVRIIRALMGVAVAFGVCIFFNDMLWDAVRQPAAEALTSLGLSPNLAQITPTEGFSIIWIRLPVLAALFIASPWVLYQVWAFISPGLYKRERRYATPFILSTAGLFCLGGAFAYFVAFRFGLVFLLGIGSNKGVTPMISITEYFDLFVNVILGVAIVFELPVLIFFLTLIRVASPRFLLRHSRYAILLIVLAAAIITPTPDVYNLMIFAVPMILLYFVGVFASFLLVLNREGKSFPWGKVAIGVLVVAGLFYGALYMAMQVYGLHWVSKWPFLVK
jgi:sec-independent protein translocase protein TatC